MMPTIKEYIEICLENANNRNSWDLNWEENNVSNEIAYFFQEESIFKEFLKSVINKPIYCEDNKNDELLKLNEEKINNLKFKKMRFPKVRVKIYTSKEKKEIDILFEGENFICIIENKFGSKEHSNQCQYYKKYVIDRCKNEKKIPICIFLDTEHSDKCISEEDFKKSECYKGYYLALYGKNVLPVLENNCEHEILGDDMKKFCNFLKEVYWSSFENIKSEKKNRIKDVKNILKNKKKEDIHYYGKPDEIHFKENDKEYYIDRAGYLRLSCLNENEIDESMKMIIKEM